ncbi:polymorphic toxin-type HINT domain-containing protein [Halostreptopolyspora alba]|uniref:Hint domain-containing protein n=1 Tax=Halostreptopolyspora alba TaxID=2487137 RepID=A0A3N0ED68_9ACTN|nr:hypothetical protein EFW17_07420 [Nocardiopsaceae bacterium YIM 96095]
MTSRLPTELRWARILLLLFAFLALTVGVSSLWLLGPGTESAASAVYIALPGFLALGFGLRLPRGRRVLFWSIVALQVWLLLKALATVTEQDPRGVTQLVLPIVVLVLVTRRPARNHLRGRPTRAGSNAPGLLGWIHNPERGASFLEYTGVITLVAAIFATVAMLGVAERPAAIIHEELERILGNTGPVAGGSSNGGGGDDGSHARGGGGSPEGDEDDDTANEGGAPGDGGGDDGCGWNPICHAGNGAEAIGNGASAAWNWTTETALPQVGGFFSGIGQSIWNDISGIGDIFTTNPLDTLSGIWDTVTNDPLSLVISPEAREAWGNGDYGEALGRGAWDTGSWFVPVVGWGAKGGKLGKLGGLGDNNRNNGHDSDSDDKNNEEDNDSNLASCATGGNSFVPGTRVLLADGSTAPIEDIDTGDSVLATNPETGESGARPVTDTISGEGRKTLVDVTVAGDDGVWTISATDGHPFWAPRLETWVDAVDLRSGTWLRTSAGSWVQVRAVEVRTVDGQAAYNLTVHDLHTYYVQRGGAAVLVHNDNGSCPEFDNQKPGELDEELAQAERLDVEPMRVTDGGFEELANSGRLKWAVTTDGELFVIPKWKNGQELSHTVLTGGKPVRAAGETDIAGADGNYFGLEIDNHSGHYQPSPESVEIGKEAFSNNGIEFQ